MKDLDIFPSDIQQFLELCREWQQPLALNTGLECYPSNIRKLISQQEKWQKVFQPAVRSELNNIFKLLKASKTFPQALNLDSFARMESIIEKVEIEPSKKQQIREYFSNAQTELRKHKGLSFDSIMALIGVIIRVLSFFLDAKETIYDSIVVNPIAEVCGVLNALEKEAVKFAAVDSDAGALLFQYPKGKKTIHFLMKGTQICLIAEPKGNARRVKIVYQLDDGTQISGYIERNKLKRLYKVE